MDQRWTATEGWEDFSGQHSNSGTVVAINGGKELTDVHGETPTGHVMTRVRHQERESEGHNELTYGFFHGRGGTETTRGLAGDGGRRRYIFGSARWRYKVAVTLEHDREGGAVRASVFKAGKLLGVQGKVTQGGRGLHRRRR